MTHDNPRYGKSDHPAELVKVAAVALDWLHPSDSVNEIGRIDRGKLEKLVRRIYDRGFRDGQEYVASGGIGVES